MSGTSATGAAPRRGAKAYLGATFVAQLCALARYTLLARLLGPEQLGIGVALILTSQFFDAITDSGSDRFLVQDKQGNAPEVQRLVHLVLLGRGLFIGGLLIVLAIPLAKLYGAQELRSAFPVLALVPIIAGLTHLDLRRIQRMNDFRTETRALVASEIGSLFVTGVTALITRDFTAILYGLIARSILIAGVSHLFAERPYSIGFVKEHARRLTAFSIPLMINGLFLFIGSQGDRLLIGKEVGLKALGYYSAAMLLIYYPSAVIQRYTAALHLPLLAGAAEGEPKHRAAERLGGQALLLALAMLVGYAAVTPLVIPLLYGEKFRQPAFLIAAIGALQTSRFMVVWPVTIALSKGRSGTVLIGNLIRSVGFAAALAASHFIGGLFAMLVAFWLAEILSLTVTAVLALRHIQVPISAGLSRILLFSSSCALVLAWSVVLGQPTFVRTAMLALLSVFVAALVLFKERHVVEEALTLLPRRR